MSNHPHRIIIVLFLFLAGCYSGPGPLADANESGEDGGQDQPESDYLNQNDSCTSRDCPYLPDTRSDEPPIECAPRQDVQAAFTFSDHPPAPVWIDVTATIAYEDQEPYGDWKLGLEYSLGSEPPAVHELRFQIKPAEVLFFNGQVHFRYVEMPGGPPYFGGRWFGLYYIDRETLLIAGVDADRLFPVDEAGNPDTCFYSPLILFPIDGICPREADQERIAVEAGWSCYPEVVLDGQFFARNGRYGLITGDCVRYYDAGPEQPARRYNVFYFNAPTP